MTGGFVPEVVIRIRYAKRGGHYHCRVFTAPAVDQTFAKCGEVVFDDREWDSVVALLASVGVEFVNEGLGNG